MLGEALRLWRAERSIRKMQAAHIWEWPEKGWTDESIRVRPLDRAPEALRSALSVVHVSLPDDVHMYMGVALNLTTKQWGMRLVLTRAESGPTWDRVVTIWTLGLKSDWVDWQVESRGGEGRLYGVLDWRDPDNVLDQMDRWLGSLDA